MKRTRIYNILLITTFLVFLGLITIQTASAEMVTHNQIVCYDFSQDLVVLAIAIFATIMIGLKIMGGITGL